MTRSEAFSGTHPASKARFLLIGATLLWGLSFPLMRALELAQRAQVPGISDATMACGDMAMRCGLAALLLLPFYGPALRRVSSREWSQAAGLALFAAAGLYLQTLGLASTDASITAFLTQLYTLIVPLIVAFRDRCRPSLRTVLACGLVLFGIALLSPGLLTHFVLGPGAFVILLSTFFMAGQIVWVERPVYAANRPGVVTFLMFSLLTLVFVLLYPATGGTAMAATDLFGTGVLWSLTLALVLFCTVLNFFIMNAWQRCISATEAGLIYCLEPVIATVLSAFLPGWISQWAGISYPNEMLTWTLLIGGVLIIGATVLVATEPRPKLPRPDRELVEDR